MTHVGSFYHELSKVSLSTSVCQFCRSDQDCERSLEAMNFGRLRANDGQLEYPQRALFHLCCLRGRSVKHRLEIGSATLPRHIDSFPHGMRHDEELRGPPVLVPPRRHDVGLRHSRVDDSRKQTREQGTVSRDRK